MNHRFSLLALVALLVLTIAGTGCKEGSIIDAKISPSDTALGVYSTELGCITRTYYDDTAVTGLFISGLPVYQGAGHITDPFFGTMTGYTAFQVIPDNPSIAVYNNATIDSAFLVLPYAGYTYGDTTDNSLTQTYQAFFLDEDIAAGTPYYSYTTKKIDEATPLSNPYTVKVNDLSDSVTIKGKNYAPALRMPLNLGGLLARLNPALQAATDNPNTPNSAFNTFFKGLVVRPVGTTPTKAYPFFRLNGSNSSNAARITVYYHTNGSTSDTAVQQYFFNGEACGFYNNVSKSYATSPVNALITSTQPGDSIIAIQNQPGACLDVKITGIMSLPKGVINKAQLQLAMLPAYNELNYDPLSRLYPRKVANGVYPTGIAAGAVVEVNDRYPLTSLSPITQIMDGQLYTLKRDNQDVRVYSIGLPREIMGCIAAGQDTLHLRITGTQDYIGAYRAILGGGNHPNSLYKAKLFVVYSKLN